jgi:hypothetical protein
MFELGRRDAVSDLDGLLTALLHVEDGWRPNAERVDQLDAIERAKAALAAVQARVTEAFVVEEQQVAAEWRVRAREAADAGDFHAWRAARDEALRHADETRCSGTARGSRRERQRDRVGVVAQVALARRVSPSRAALLVRAAQTLVNDLPCVLAAMEAGQLSEWRAEIVVRETAVLTSDQRRLVDSELASALAGEWGRLGDAELGHQVRAVVYRVDAQAVVERARIAESQRRVTLRPAPDTMCHLTATLPVAQGVAALAALTKAADSARADGDERTRGQLMADTLVGRLTGREAADDVALEVQVVIGDRALLTGDDTPAHVPGYGPVPARWARDLIARTGHRESTPATVWLRRLYTHPADGTLVAMDSSRRLFDGALRRFLVARDGGTCRQPWCDAPIRHLDHVVDHARGGPTSADNGQGTCVRDNLVKQTPGFASRVVDHPPDELPGRRHGHTVEVTTPTGHRYYSTASAPPGSGHDGVPDGRESPGTRIREAVAGRLRTAPPAPSAALMSEVGRMDVLISGAGIAGLTAAHWLRRYGFNPTVVERAPTGSPSPSTTGSCARSSRRTRSRGRGPRPFMTSGTQKAAAAALSGADVEATIDATTDRIAVAANAITLKDHVTR